MSERINRREFVIAGGGFLFQVAAIKNDLIVRSDSPTDFETPVHLLDRSWITPNDVHYVRCHLPTPAIRPDAWNLTIEGEVNQPLKLAMNDIHSFREVSQTVTLECSGNGRAFADPPVPGLQWEKGAVGTARWTGISLRDVLAKAQKIAYEDKGIQPQATGQLHAGSNLRLSPDRSSNENIMMRLDSGSSFDVIGWSRVPKFKGAESTESDTAPKAGTAISGNNKKDQDDEENPEDQETTELWYKVRLSPSTSPAPEGWIFGKQVELTVPSDIIYYRTGTEFVAWRRLD